MKQIPKIETRFEVNTEAEGNAQLILYGAIRKASWWDDAESVISADRVIKALAECKGKNIDVHINSGGGDVFESIAIRNNLNNHDGDIDIYIDALAGSGASIIATAGKNIYMYDNSMQMIHNAWTIVAGNAKALRKQADDLDKIDEAVTASYKTNFVGTEEELKQLLADESFLTAQDCLELGFCTAIIEQKKEKDQEPQGSIKASLLAKYAKSEPLSKGTGSNNPLFENFKKSEVS